MVILYKIFRRLVMILSRHRFAAIGRGVVFDPFSQLSHSTMYIGDDVYIGPGAFISTTHGKIVIGSHTIFGPNVSIYGGNHIFDKVGTYVSQAKKESDHVDPDVIIGKDVWIGGDCVILPGVCIHDGAIVGAGSVVTKDIAPYTVNVGNPCRFVKNRFTEANLAVHKELIS